MITNDRYLELIKVCNDARVLYIQGAETGISDELYDSYMADIREYEASNPINPDSPTQSINPDMGDGDVVHPYKMLSLLDVFTTEDAGSFLSKNPEAQMYSVEYKLDGLSVQLIYEDGKLVSASTRGDGTVGVECLDTARYIPSIPKEIGVSGTVVVRGEVFMTKSRFEEYCKVYGKQANPRNTAVGIFKRKSEINRAKYLNFQAFNLENADDRRNEIAEASAFWGADTHGLCLERLAMWGFKVVRHWAVTDKKELFKIIDEVRKNRENEDIPIDGLVIKVDDLQIRKKLGDNGKIPHWAVAYKFPAQEQETDLLGVEWQVGATGDLTPVAILEPVLVMGSTISKATLHNYKRMQELDIQIGDKVVVYKAGDIIPAIKTARHTEKSRPIELPTKCPSCGADLILGSVTFTCCNIQCKDKLLARLNTWASKGVGNFKGVAGALITALYDRGKLKTPADFYKVKPIDIMTLPNTGSAKMNTFMLRVDTSRKEMTFEQILVGLSVNNLSKAGATALTAHLKKQCSTFSGAFNAFLSMSQKELQAVLGKAKGESVYEQIHDPFIQQIILDVREVFANRTF